MIAIQTISKFLANLRANILVLPAVKVRWLMVLTAMAVAAQIQYIQHGWINPDSVIYLEAAKLMSIGDWQAALNAFNWPLYSACITAVYSVFQWLPFANLTIHASAQLLNVVFFGLAMVAFLKIIELAGGKSLHLVIGTLIVVSAQYLVGDALSMLMRDEGFWAFYLLSLFYFIRFYQSDRLNDALIWQLCILIATLFRIEAITYLLLLPLMIFSIKEKSWSERFRKYLRCNLLNISVLLVMFAIIAMSEQISLQTFGRIQEVFTLNLYDELTRKLLSRVQLMSNLVLGKFLEEFAIQGLIFTFAYVIAVKVLSASGFINVGLAIGCIRSKGSVDLQVKKVLYIAGGLALFNMALIITKVFVLSGRYVLAFSWIVLILATFFMTALIQNISVQSSTFRKWLVAGLLIFMVLGLIKNLLPKNADHNYQQQAVSWLNAKNIAKKPVFYDDARIKYYASAPFTGTWQDTEAELKKAITNKRIYEHEYLVITLSSKRPEKTKLIEDQLDSYKAIKRFEDAKKKKSVVIYQRNSQ